MPAHPLEELSVQFPEGVYADVRFERTIDHRITLRDGSLDDVQSKVETGALLRVLKGGRWYYACTTDLDRIDATLADLAASNALQQGGPEDVAERYEICRDKVWAFDDERVDEVPLKDKLELLRLHAARLNRASIRTWTARWIDQHRDRRFVSSLGADVSHDYQEAGVILRFSMADADQTLDERFTEAGHRFSDLKSSVDAHGAQLELTLDKCERFVAEAVPVEAGMVPVILSPEVAGVFAHESFGHKSEADFMLGDPAMLEEWKLGVDVASPIVSIVDTGDRFGSGYMPYDDEGQKTSPTYLIKNGVLSGRLHSAMTATALDEAPTANARAISFRFEPIVRMTTTFFEPGVDTRESLFSSVKDGYFIETVKHGSGMSTFTIAPGLSWRIRDGKIAEPVRIAVMTGTVFDTMGEIDGLSDTIELPFFVGGGCGKMEQWPLSVGLGGPYVRVRRINVA
jgi:TldD protein